VKLKLSQKCFRSWKTKQGQLKMASIHPSSVISNEVELGANVEIGPFCHIKGKVRIGDNTVIESHVSIGNQWGIVEIGKNNRIASGAAIGGPPQDLSYKGEPTKLIIGDDNVIREFVTLNCGTAKGEGVTRIGSHCMIMAYSHVAHDCRIGDYVVIANSNQLAGHVVLEDHVKTGGMCGVNQFTRIGRYSFIAGDSAVNKDVLPYTIAQGKFAVMRAPNSIGLERAGFPKEDIEAVKRAVRIITKGGGTVDEALARIAAECGSSATIQYLVDFVKSSVAGPRGIAI
jgi:UDP-N-acetylglucosamine acyltransferase